MKHGEFITVEKLKVGDHVLFPFVISAGCSAFAKVTSIEMDRYGQYEIRSLGEGFITRTRHEKVQGRAE